MAGRLEGKVAVITGGASGIGRASAARFAAEGARIVIADLSEARAQETIAEVRAAASEAVFVKTDTSVLAENEALADAAIEAFGTVDILVAAAGVSNARYVSGEVTDGPANPTAGFIINKPVEYWEKVLAVNLTGVMYTDRAIARRMVDRGIKGSIINISSAASKVPLPGAADYCVSKAGVWMLTKVLAVELAGHGIRVNAIGPGYIDTPMTAGASSDEARRRYMVSTMPLGRMGEAEDVANTALFLASDESSFFTGEILFPDGGMFTG